MTEPAAERSPDEIPLAEHFRLMAATVERDGGVTYPAICRAVAEDPQLLALLEQAPLAQRRPNLLMAAVHFLLLGGVAHPLAAHYDTVRLVTGDTLAPPPAGADVVADFKDFCLTQRAALLPLVAVRSTQTNEVGRCAALLPALCTIAASYPEHQPLSLLDLGTSAGLNLLFDRYAYTYRQQADSAVVLAGADGSPVRLDCTVRGELAALPSLRRPAVTTRAGLDRQPIDPMSEDASRWLLACQWPDDLPRFSRLRAALEVARNGTERPAIFEGDLVDDLDRVASTIDDSCPLIIFHSWVAAYLTEARQGELVRAVQGLGTTRPVHHLYAEEPAETRGLPTPPSPQPRPSSDLVTALVHIGPGGVPPVRLADMHPHGKWLQWWAPLHRATTP